MTEKPIIYISENNLPENSKIIEAYENSLKELFSIRNPKLKGSPDVESSLKDFLEKTDIEPIWIFYPWNNFLIHSLPEKEYFELRTARNKNLVTKEEQEKYRNLKIGIAGLSVGSSIIQSLVLTGGPKTIKIADFDNLEGSNLNRINARLMDVGEKKTDIMAQWIYERDPFADVYIFESGVSKEIIKEFILGTPKLDIFIDEMDDVYMKLYAREICRKNGIPVLMAGDNGDAGLIDVERYDLEPNLPLLHGLIGDAKAEDFAHIKPGTPEWKKIVAQIFEPHNFTLRHQKSFTDLLNREITGAAQLGSTAQMNGAILSVIIRDIANDYDTASGRRMVNVEKTNPSYHTPERQKEREASTKEFNERLKTAGM